MLGFRQNEIFDVRHVYPSTTYVKFFSKLSVHDKQLSAIEIQ